MLITSRQGSTLPLRLADTAVLGASNATTNIKEAQELRATIHKLVGMV